MKVRYLLLLLIFSINTGWADFSDTDVDYHPTIVDANQPFIIDVTGEWPTDCDPGDQKPVISEYTGDTVLIEFETIVEHEACGYVLTPYRVLVDMSDVIGSVEGDFPSIEITIRFDGQELIVQAPESCTEPCDAPKPENINPEAGLYFSKGLDKQGLLLARQNLRMAAYPLIYDEAGSSEWVFGGSGIVEDVFFTDLYELTGGQCLGCPAPADPPQMDIVGKLSMLMDSEGIIQVKVNDGLFVTYEQTDFGYGRIRTGSMSPGSVADLSGRWAFVEDFVPHPLYPPGTDSNVGLIPLVFDIEALPYGHYPTSENPVALPQESPALPNYIMFSVKDKAGKEVALMKCHTVFDMIPQKAMECDVFNEDWNNGATIYKVRVSSLERIKFRYVGPILSIPQPDVTPIAVRID